MPKKKKTNKATEAYNMWMGQQKVGGKRLSYKQIYKNITEKIPGEDDPEYRKRIRALRRKKSGGGKSW